VDNGDGDAHDLESTERVRAHQSQARGRYYPTILNLDASAFNVLLLLRDLIAYFNKLWASNSLYRVACNPCPTNSHTRLQQDTLHVHTRQPSTRAKIPMFGYTLAMRESQPRGGRLSGWQQPQMSELRSGD